MFLQNNVKKEIVNIEKRLNKVGERKSFDKN